MQQLKIIYKSNASVQEEVLGIISGEQKYSALQPGPALLIVSFMLTKEILTA